MLPSNLRKSVKRGRAIVFAAIAAAIVPPAPMTVSAWADEYRFVSSESGSPKPGKWDTDYAPYLRDIMDCLSVAHPAREVTFVKSTQVGGSEVGLNLFGYVVGHDPGPMLIVQSSIEEARTFVSTKLQETIDVTPQLRQKVRQQRSRSEDGSRTFYKKFSGGFCEVVGANSSKGLQSRSIKYLYRDEISEWPADIPGAGDPMDMSENRLDAFDDNGAKIYNCSTPGIKGACRVTAKFLLGDMRQLYLPCPHCDTYQVFEQENLEEGSHDGVPGLSCRQCGAVIEEKFKRQMLANYVFVPTFASDNADNPTPPDLIAAADIKRWAARNTEGREPSFRVWAIHSPTLGWARILVRMAVAEGDDVKQKNLDQRTFARAYEMQTNAPDYEELLKRRENFPQGRVPAGAYIVTGAADIQGNRIEWAVWAWGPKGNVWLIDHGVIAGDPQTDKSVWRKLDTVTQKKYRSDWGRTFEIEAFGVDSGYLSQDVYNFARRRPSVHAVDGRGSPTHPVVGTEQPVDVDVHGRKVKGAATITPVGTFIIKGYLYGGLRRLIEGPDEDGVYQSGTVHIGLWLEEPFVKQLTAEYMHTETDKKGFEKRAWKKRAGQANELLDLYVYGRAMVAKLGYEYLDADQWSRLIADRGNPDPEQQPDLEDLWSPASAALQVIDDVDEGSDADTAQPDVESAEEAGRRLARAMKGKA